MGDRIVAAFVAVTLALLAVLVGVIIYLVIQVSDIQGGQQADNITSCQESNASRADDVTLWEHLLTLPPDATAAQKATAARDLALVRKAYALRDCAAEYG